MTLETTLGDVIRKIREKVGLNQSDFGREVGVVTNTVSAYERGDRLPEIDTLIKIAVTFKADLTELLKLRVLASQNFELENEAILTFFNKINAYDLLPSMPNQMAKQQLNYLNFANVASQVSAPNSTVTTGLEIHKEYFINCCHAVFHFYNQVPPRQFFDQIPQVVDVHNFIRKLSPILGVDAKSITSLQPSEIEKLMLGLSVLNRIPKNDHVS